VKEYKLLLSYLDKKSRLPDLPQGLSEAIFEWARVPYTKNMLAVYKTSKRTLEHFGLSKKPKPLMYTKTFKVQDERIDVKNLQVHIIPKEANGQEAVYDENYNRITLYLQDVLEETKNNLTIHKIEKLLYYLKSNIDHELTHFVQFNTPQSVGGTTVFHSDYKSLSDDYYISPVEYKPILSNEVNDFLYNYNSMKDIPKFIEESHFFSALKRRAYGKYKNAVKDFTILVQNSIS